MKSLFFNADVILISVALMFSILIALISYYKIPWAGERKIVVFLFGIRMVSVFIIFFLISEPILTFVSKLNQPPVIAVLVDDSKSMGIRDRLGDRKEITRNTISEIIKLEVPGKKKFFLFAGDVSEKNILAPDSLKFSGGLTDITRALKKIQEISERENIKSAILVSDGIYNSGENPIYFSEKFEIPIFTVGVGDSGVQKDLRIVDVLANEVTYAEVETPISVKIESAGLEGKNIEVYLYEEGNEIARNRISLDAGINEYTVNFKFVPKEEGLKKFTVKVQKVPDEITYENNQKSFYIKVLRSKYKILIVSGAPSPDLAFVKRVLTENKNYEVLSYTEKRGKDFIEGNFDFKVVEKADVVVFIGYPVKTSDAEIINGLKNIVLSLNKPVFFIISRKIDFNKLKIFSEFLPFKFSNVSDDEEVVNLVITERGRNHLVTDLGDRNHIWNILPPIFKLRGVFNAGSGSIVLAKTRYQNVETEEPLIIANQLGDRKVVSVLCYGIWRWKLLTAPNSEFEGFFETFINNVIRWLVAPVGEEYIRFKIAKNFFDEEEKVEFLAQVYNEDYSSMDDADVRVKILSQTSGEIADELTLERVSPGIYYASVNLPKGDYRYEAKVSRRGRDLKSFSGRFTVGESEIEFLNTRMDAKLLREIAWRTGGTFVTDKEVSSLSKIISSLPNFEAKVVEKRKEYILRTRVELLLAAIFLLSIEWFLRKRYGLA